MSVVYLSSSTSIPLEQYIQLGAQELPIDTNITILLPSNVGNNNQILKTDGNNPCNLSFINNHEVGDLKQSTKSSNHSGWLLCNGNAISRTTYSQLFGEIGTSFGVGNGSTTFNIPDARGKVIGYVSDSHSLGSSIGSETKTLSTSEMPSHNHTINITDPGHTHTVNTISQTGSGSISVALGSTHPNATITSSTNTCGITSTSDNTGSGSSFNIMNPTLYAGNLFIYCNV